MPMIILSEVMLWKEWFTSSGWLHYAWPRRSRTLTLVVVGTRPDGTTNLAEFHVRNPASVPTLDRTPDRGRDQANAGLGRNAGGFPNGR